MPEEVGRLEASFHVDLSPLQRGLKQASGLMSAWAKRHADDTEAEVGVNLSPLMRGLSEASNLLKKFDGKEATVRLGVNTRDAKEDTETFLSWVRKQSADLQIGAVTSGAQRAAEIAAAYIGQLSANIDVNANTAGAMASGKAATSRINQMTGEIGVGADVQGVTGEVQNVARRVSGMRTTFDVGANTRPAQSELAGFNQTIRRYSRSWGSQGIRARVIADTKQAQAQVRNLERVLQSTTDATHRVRVEAEVARARGQLRGLQQVATGLGMQNPTVNTSVRGVAASTAQMMGLYALADRLDGYNVRFTASVDQTISKVLPQALGSLEMQVARFRTVLVAASAVSVPAFQASIAALPGVLSMAGAATGALATRLGAGLAGAMGSVGSAAVLGGAALGAYGYAMRRTLSYAFNLSSMLGDQKNRIDDAADAVKVAKAAVASATPGTQEYTNAVRGLAFAEQNAAFETRKMNAMMGYATPNMLKLNAAANDISIEFIKLGSAMSDAQAPMLTRWIRGLTAQMQSSRGAIVGMVTDMNKVVASFVRVMKTGANFANLKTIFSGIRSAGVPAMQILTGAVQIFVNTFAATVPTGLKVLNILARLTQSAAIWTSTASGQNRIRSIWAGLVAAGTQLWRIVKNVGAGLASVLIVLNRSGIGQGMMAGLAGIAAGFRKVMQEGNGGRHAVMQMANYTRPVLSALANLVGYLGRQFGAMAMEVGKSGVIVDVIKALNTALRGTKTSMGIIPALRHEFKVIGPLLPPLIKQLGLWFSTFMYAQPEMVLFIKTMTRVLAAFNSLPQPVQRTVARMLAWGSVIQMLGGGALIGLIAKIVLFRRTMATMNAVLVATGARSATQVGIFGRMRMAVTGAATATWTWVRAQTAAAVASVRWRATQAALNASMFITAVKTKGLIGATRALVAATWASVASSRAATVAMRAMGVAATFMLGPWGLAIAAIVAVGVALVVAWRRSERFRQIVKGIGKSFIDNKGASAVWMGAINGIRGALDRAGGAGNIARNAFSKLGQKLTDNTGASRALKPAINGVGSALQGIGGKLADVNRKLEKQGGGIANVRRQWQRPPIYKRQDWGGKIIGLWNEMQRKSDQVTSAIANHYRTRSEDARSRWMNRFNSLRNQYFPWLGSVEKRVGQWGTDIANIYQRRSSDAGNRWMNRFNKLRNGQYFPWLTDVQNRVGKWGSKIVDIYQSRSNNASDRWMSRFNKLKNNQYAPWLGDMKDRTGKWGNKIVDIYRSRSENAGNRWMERFNNLKDRFGPWLSDMFSRIKTWGNNIGSLFKKIRDMMVNPIETAKNILKGIWNSILSGISKVLGAVGLDDAAKKVSGAKWAKGGTTEGRGGQAFANGGTTVGFRQFARGGMGTDGKQPRVHLWNEQMGNEAFVAENGPPRKQISYLQTGAGWFDHSVVPNEALKPDAPRRERAYRHGRLGSAATFAAFQRGGLAQQMADDVSNKFGVPSSSWAGHGPGAVDWRVTPAWGMRATGASKAKGDAISSFLIENARRYAVNQLVWYNRIWTGSGWAHHGGGYGAANANANTSQHYDHVHGRSGSGTFQGGGGGFFASMPNPLQILFEKIWKNTVGRTMDGFKERVAGGHVMRAGTASAATMVTDSIYDWIDSKIPDTIGGGSGANYSGINASNNRQLGKKMLAASGVRGSWPSLDQLWQKESGWNERADNPTSAAYGIPQANPGSKMASHGSNWRTNPKTQIAWGLDYIRGRYGSTDSAWGHSQRVGWYRRGGVIPGPTGAPRTIGAHAGERVLPADLNTGFESLARSIELWSARGSNAPTVETGSDSREVREQNELLREQNALLEKIYREHPERTGRSVRENVQRSAREDRDMQESIMVGQSSRQIVRGMRGKG